MANQNASDRRARIGRWRAWLCTLVLAATLPLAGESGARDAARKPAASEAVLSEVPLQALPAEAHATLALIRTGGPFPYRKDGSVFGNRERRLPLQPRGYYTEYTVPTPGARNRGARRIVAGRGPGGNPATSGEYYYTGDHYATFQKIRE